MAKYKWVIVADSKVAEAPHKFDSVISGWEIYPQIQLKAAIEAAKAICEHFSITDICGHDDFAAYRNKRDPGPIFPMSEFIEKVIGINEGESAGSSLMEVHADNGLNLRAGPEVGSPKVDRKPNPLPKGTKVRIARQNLEWVLVHVLDDAGKEIDTGWCFASFLGPARP